MWRHAVACWMAHVRRCVGGDECTFDACGWQVDIRNPDLKRFPRHAEATFYGAVLEPGDVRAHNHDLQHPTTLVSSGVGPHD